MDAANTTFDIDDTVRILGCGLSLDMSRLEMALSNRTTHAPAPEPKYIENELCVGW